MISSDDPPLYTLHHGILSTQSEKQLNKRIIDIILKITYREHEDE